MNVNKEAFKEIRKENKQNISNRQTNEERSKITGESENQRVKKNTSKIIERELTKGLLTAALESVSSSMRFSCFFWFFCLCVVYCTSKLRNVPALPNCLLISMVFIL